MMAVSSPAWVEAAAIDGARADDRLQFAQGRLVDRRGGHVELEIADAADARRAELRVAFRVGARLRQAEIEALEQGRDRAR